jgi:lactoylglutathione lyase
VEHLAVWVHDLERMRRFYEEVLGGESGPRYHNPRTDLTSYFIAIGGGCRIELMHQPGLEARPAGPAAGYAHVALALGGREAVDDTVARLRSRGVTIASDPRTTGDGYYEAVILDPEGNRIELTA